MDTITPEERSENMRRIKSTGMKPELAVRKLVHGLGYRYRLHSRELPGKPDLVFKSRRKVIFVHGCFWHQHQAHSCKIARLPKSNSSYWLPKLARNVQRDDEHKRNLKKLGWKYLVIWECQLRNPETVARRVRHFLEKGERSVP